MIPEDLRYSSDHEWIRTLDGDATPRTPAGIPWPGSGSPTTRRTRSGDIVFVQMPEPGTTIEPGESIGEVESTKSVSDIFAPVSGTVVARNDALDAAPELVNSDPYGDGWMIEVELADPGAAGRSARRRRIRRDDRRGLRAPRDDPRRSAVPTVRPTATVAGTRHGTVVCTESVPGQPLGVGQSGADVGPSGQWVPRSPTGVDATVQTKE